MDFQMADATNNKALVLAYYQRVVAEGRFDEIHHYIGESYVDHNNPSGAPGGPLGAATHLRGIRSTFPDFTLQIHEVIAEGDWVALRVTAAGTHLGEWRGIKPSARRVALRGLNLDRVSAGRIVEHWGEADTVGMLMQMGVSPFGSG
jgi:predicted ester cyclase